MNICTISDEGWLNNHTLRFIKLARRAMPEAKFHLLLYSAGPWQNLEPDIQKLFDHVEGIDLPKDMQEARDSFNRTRMRLSEFFDIDEYLYLDPDVDVFTSLTDIPQMSDKSIGWCQSPVVHQDWHATCKIYGWDDAVRPEANNGLLYIRGNEPAEAYDKAWAEVQGMLVNPRIRGLLTFNLMLRQNPDLHFEIPYHYGCIWHDHTSTVHNSVTNEIISAYSLAKTLHYCNDAGKQERARVDGRWIYA